jgi:hypothetical protein
MPKLQDKYFSFMWYPYVYYSIYSFIRYDTCYINSFPPDN